MGGHYDSIHFKTEGRQVVLAAAEEHCAAHAARMLVGPVLNGWVSVYPQRKVWEVDAVSELSKRIPGYALHLNVYHDDILTYRLFLEGGEIDAYDSNPKYFGESDDNAMLEVGNPALFASLIQTKTADLGEVLQRDYCERHTLLEFERLQKIGKILGIRNVVTSYEYLMGGETNDIQAWKKFVEVPQAEVKREADRKRGEKATLTSNRKADMKAGELLFHKEDKVGSTDPFVLGDHFLVARCKHWSKPEIGLVSAPWRSINPVHFEGLKEDMVPRVHTAGNRVAHVTVHGAEVWEFDGSNFHKIFASPNESMFLIAANFNDYRTLRLFLRSDTGEDFDSIFDVETGEKLSTGPHVHKSMVVHPSGQWVVRHDDAIEVAEKGSQQWRRLSIQSLPAVGFRPYTSSRIGASFSPDGLHLAVTCFGGLRIFRWSQLLDSDQPAPLFVLSHPYEAKPTFDRMYQLQYCFKDGEHFLVSRGNELHLLGGLSTMPLLLLAAPVQNRINRLVVLRAESALAISYGERRTPDDLNYDHRYTFQIWSLPHLLRRSRPHQQLRVTM